MHTKALFHDIVRVSGLTVTTETLVFEKNLIAFITVVYLLPRP